MWLSLKSPGLITAFENHFTKDSLPQVIYLFLRKLVFENDFPENIYAVVGMNELRFTAAAEPLEEQNSGTIFCSQDNQKVNFSYIPPGQNESIEEVQCEIDESLNEFRLLINRLIKELPSTK